MPEIKKERYRTLLYLARAEPYDKNGNGGSMADF